MELFELTAALRLDDSEFKSGIDDAEKHGNDFGGKMSAMTVATGQMIAQVASQVASTISGLYRDAIDGYADYEQLIGGVESLFGDSAQKVIDNASRAFATTGMSANQYMDTAMSFAGALIKGLGDDTDLAAEMVDLAMLDMGDNVNKFGSDMEMVMNAYKGFSRNNFMMLDNLKLGYAGTATGMVELINDSGILEEKIEDLDGITFDQMIRAVHEIQEELGVTGTTAMEASTTISGSKNAMSASWTDLLTAVASTSTEQLDNAMGQFKETFSTYMQNLLPAMIRTFANGDDLIVAIADAISTIPEDSLGDLLGGLIESTTGVFKGATTLANWFSEQIGAAFTGFSLEENSDKVNELAHSIGEFVSTAISNIVSDLPTFVSGILTLGGSIVTGLLGGIYDGLFTPAYQADVDKITSQLGSDLSAINIQTQEGEGLLDYLDTLVAKYGEEATKTAEWKEATEQLEGIYPNISEALTAEGGTIEENIKKAREMTAEIKKQALQQAMNNALQEEYTKQAEYQRNIVEAQIGSDIAQSKIDSTQAAITGSADAYARAITDWMEQNYNMANIGGSAAEMYNTAQAIINGDFVGTFEDMVTFLQDVANTLDYEMDDDMVRPWDASETDNFLSIDQIKQYSSLMQDWQEDIKAYDETIQTNQAAYDAMTAQIDITTAAIEKSFSIADTAAGNVATAMQTAADKIANLSFGGGGGMFTRHATGLYSVPYNGYLAELHQNEAVLTAAQADAWRRGGGKSGGGSGVDYATLSTIMGREFSSQMRKVNIYMGSERVGNLTSEYVSQDITRANTNRMRALGG